MISASTVPLLSTARYPIHMKGTVSVSAASRRVTSSRLSCSVRSQFPGRSCPNFRSVHTYSTTISGTEVEHTYNVRNSERRKFGTVFVGGSEVASLINLNPHVTVADAIERLWEKTNRKLFREALTRNRLEFYTQEERLEELGALSLAKAVVEADDPKEYRERLATTLEKATTVQDRNIVKDFINTSRGIKSEKETFELLKENRPNGDLKRDGNRYHKAINIPCSRLSYLLSGYIDGVETDNRRIVEIKTRQSRLFHHVPLYEQVQCQAYLFLTGLSTCEHVESFRGTHLSTTLQHDPLFWNHVVERLNQVIIAFYRLLNDETIQDDFLQRRGPIDGVTSRKNARGPRKARERSTSKSLVFDVKTAREAR